jgi:hypothetical protein
MDPRLRDTFNRHFTDALWRGYADRLSGRLGARFEFRLAESPVFLPDDLRVRMARAAEEILAQLMDPSRLAQMSAAIPARWNAPGMDSVPSFTQIDFAVVREQDGTLGPRLIELQGFPSLTAMQVIQCDAWSDALRSIPGLDLDWTCWFSGLSRSRAVEVARSTIVGEEDPRTVIMMDLDPRSQKTWPDFAATKLLFDVDAVCPTELVRRGRTLFRRTPEGTELPVRRIYNRVVFDELIQRGTNLPFDYRDELDVQWAPHPNWYWVWSKYSIPLLDHPAVPRAFYLHELREIPEDLSRRFVLKPLFSFAGGGVRIEPTADDIRRIPPGERRGWCLQEKIAYEPALLDADGSGIKVEIRLMFFRPDGVIKPLLVQNLCRLSRGLMHGVDFNKSYTWVGSSIALWPAASA